MLIVLEQFIGDPMIVLLNRPNDIGVDIWQMLATRSTQPSLATAQNTRKSIPSCSIISAAAVE